MAERRPTSVDRKRERSSNRKTKTPKKKSWLKRILFSILLIGLAGLIGGVSLFAYYASSAPELDEELLKFPLSSEIYDVNGEMIANLGAEKRTFVPYEEIPQQMIDAIIATEDARFFEHSGIDIWRLGSAVIANLRDGFGAQGASTITQQVVKNSFLTNEKKLKRKAQEAWLAIKLERAYSKEEIFEMYFNRVLMSGTVYGFGTAAEHFYGKELNELTLDEMAQLAGMPQSPNNYNPFNHPEKAQKRRDIVLGLMVQHGKITQAEADESKKVQVADTVLPAEQRKTNAMKYPAFVDIVLDELRKNGDEALLSEGIKIYTTLDPKAQQTVENVMNNAANFPNETIQSGVAVIDTKTGAIRAIGGGRNYDTGLKFNRATDIAGRSIGSVAKPLVAYGPAIEHLKWSTGQTTVDEKMTYPNSKQVIQNWDGRYNGTMTIREALYTSRNVPAVKTLLEVGYDKPKEFMSNLGIKMEKIYPSTTLGPEVNITPVQMASAYAAFGNNGVFTKGHAITKIVYRDGVTEKNYAPTPKVAMSDYTAYMVTDILRDTVSNLPGASATHAIIGGVDIAGKTGTSNYSSEDFDKYNLGKSAVPDSWFAGYTTDYSIAIWSGYDDYGTPITTWPERRLPQTLFKSIMNGLIQSSGKPERFKKPNSVVEATIEIGTSPLQLASEFTPDEKKSTELFVKGTQPTTVSDKYQAPEIGTVTNLKADLLTNILTNNQSINLSWDYNAPTSDEGEETNTPNEKPKFEVTMAIGNEPAVVVTTTEGNRHSIPSIQPGETYTFTVTPIILDNRGETVTTTILVPPLDEVIDGEDENTTPDDNNGNNGNSGNNGNNGNNNGNPSEGRPNPSNPEEDEEEIEEPSSPPNQNGE